MESVTATAECSEYDSNNNNNIEENTTTTTIDSSVLPLLQLQKPFFLEFPGPEPSPSPSPAPAPAHDLPDAESFVADPAFMETLTEEHGFSDVAARKALYWTKNESLVSALLWLCDRSPETYETALEDELDQMKEEFERINQEEGMSRLASLNPDIVCGINSTVGIDELLSNSEEETEEEELEFVVILNSRGCRRMGYVPLIRFVKEAVRNLVYNISLTSAATEKLDSWEEGCTSTPDVLIGWAEGSPHMSDLELCARNLSLHTGLAGQCWDPMKLRYRDIMALAVWGNSTDLQQAVGRLIPVSARK